MENKEQTSLEKEYVLLICPNCKELLKDENMGKMCPNCKEWTYTYQCKSVLISKTALADQKHKIFLWFHNWLIQKELNMKLKDWSSTELKRDFDKEF